MIIGSKNKWRKSKEYVETNENENKTYQNLSAAAKTIAEGKFIAISAHLNKQENFK